jgi:hypothetical protein
VAWTNRVIAALPVYPALGPLTADAINNRGQILRNAQLDLGRELPAPGFIIDFNPGGLAFTVIVRPFTAFLGGARMNNHGEIIANTNRACGHEIDGIFFKNGSWSCFGNISDLQPGGCPTVPSFFDEATGLNNKGDIVGWVATPLGMAGQLEDSEGNVTVLPPLTTCAVTHPAAINDSRLIVGSTFSSALASPQGVMWEGGKVEALK